MSEARLAMESYRIPHPLLPLADARRVVNLGLDQTSYFLPMAVDPTPESLERIKKVAWRSVLQESEGNIYLSNPTVVRNTIGIGLSQAGLKGEASNAFEMAFEAEDPYHPMRINIALNYIDTTSEYLKGLNPTNEEGYLPANFIDWGDASIATLEETVALLEIAYQNALGSQAYRRAPKKKGGQLIWEDGSLRKEFINLGAAKFKGENAIKQTSSLRDSLLTDEVAHLGYESWLITDDQEKNEELKAFQDTINKALDQAEKKVSSDDPIAVAEKAGDLLMNYPEQNEDGNPVKNSYFPEAAECYKMGFKQLEDDPYNRQRAELARKYLNALAAYATFINKLFNPLEKKPKPTEEPIGEVDAEDILTFQKGVYSKIRIKDSAVWWLLLQRNTLEQAISCVEFQRTRLVCQDLLNRVQKEPKMEEIVPEDTHEAKGLFIDPKILLRLVSVDPETLLKVKNRGLRWLNLQREIDKIQEAAKYINLNLRDFIALLTAHMSPNTDGLLEQVPTVTAVELGLDPQVLLDEQTGLRFEDKNAVSKMIKDLSHKFANIARANFFDQGAFKQAGDLFRIAATGLGLVFMNQEAQTAEKLETAMQFAIVANNAAISYNKARGDEAQNEQRDEWQQRFLSIYIGCAETIAHEKISTIAEIRKMQLLDQGETPLEELQAKLKALEDAESLLQAVLG